MTAFAFAVAMADLGVNGPEDDRLTWDAINWRAQEETVRRLRQRIFKATRDGDLKKVRNLQKLMLRSRANTLLSVRQATQRNDGRKTAGIDGEVAGGHRRPGVKKAPTPAASHACGTREPRQSPVRLWPHR
jgi:RNA-directed DNA polymerase